MKRSRTCDHLDQIDPIDSTQSPKCLKGPQAPKLVKVVTFRDWPLESLVLPKWAKNVEEILASPVMPPPMRITELPPMAPSKEPASALDLDPLSQLDPLDTSTLRTSDLYLPPWHEDLFS